MSQLCHNIILHVIPAVTHSSSLNFSLFSSLSLSLDVEGQMTTINKVRMPYVTPHDLYHCDILHHDYHRFSYLLKL